ncbi:MAG: type II toxin-antitoxin system RelE/ParE family toxin [Deltaproteobacteria bacterium]|nr:type II toxin-antitoxin system RelE/ParE family toxin [Deltaproteobacteria bacterium]
MTLITAEVILIMYLVEFYTDNRGKNPVAKWLDELVKSDMDGAVKIDARIQKLRKYGLKLLDTRIMKHLETKNMKHLIVADRDLYELIPDPYRVIFYHDTKQSKFILLHGFRKKRQRQNKDIDQARRLLRKYLLRVGQKQKRK